MGELVLKGFRGGDDDGRVARNDAGNEIGEFKEEIKRIDALRGEDFLTTFPELAALYKVPKALRP